MFGFTSTVLSSLAVLSTCKYANCQSDPNAAPWHICSARSCVIKLTNQSASLPQYPLTMISHIPHTTAAES